MQRIEAIVASNIRTRRRELGLTQKELAERIGYTEKAVSKWETAGSLPPSAILPVLSKVLEITMDDLMSDSSEIRYHLGVDGGGTKTEFLLTDTQGSVIKRLTLDGCNPNDIGISASLDVLHTGILSICGEISFRKISAFIGIAGGITGENPQKISAFLQKYRFGRVDNGSDAQNAVSVCLGGRDGIAVIMGTGSIAFAQKDKQLLRAGGYGQLFGDAGSGFAIGRDGILAALRQEDGSGDETALTPLVRKQCGKESILSALSDFYAGGKRTVAAYAPLVFRAAAEGDEAATCILTQNAGAIADLIRASGKHFDRDPVPAVLCGGVAVHGESMILPLIREALGEDAERYPVGVEKRSPVWGALRLSGLKDIPM